MSNRGWLRIEIENFGPIASGSFELRPLTLFIGPNNTGKSYAATLAHSIVQAMPAGDVPRVLFFRFPGKAPLTIRELANWLFSTEYLEKEVLGRLQNYFSCEDLGVLISWFASKDEVRVRVYSRDAEDGWIFLEGKGSRWSVQGKAPRLPDLERRQETEEVPLDALWRVWRDIRRVWRDITETMGLPEDSYYLPAARSGVLQGWRALTAEAVRRVSRWAGIEEIRVPALPGLIGEFLEGLIHASEGLRLRSRAGKRRPFFRSILEVLEKDLLKGTVDFSYPNEVPVPEIVYRTQVKQKKLEIPIQRASSTVGELAPLVLWIKYLLEPREMLVIEEPEAHLHPENQRRVARALVRLVRAGVTVLCTTHSPLILHQVSNHILASRADPARRKELGFTEEDLLREEEVGAYLFRMREDGRGSEIQPLHIEPGFGIPEDEFVRVSEAIGEETYRLTGPLRMELGEE